MNQNYINEILAIIRSNKGNDYIKEEFVFEEPLYLSNIEKEIFKLKFIEGKTSKQIALELKLPIKKVYEATDRIKRKSKKVRNDDKN